VLICFFATRSWFIPALAGAHIVILLIVARLIGVRQRFRGKWAIWRAGQPPLFKCIFTRLVVSMTYRPRFVVHRSCL
jgi:hypothetical protein